MAGDIGNSKSVPQAGHNEQEKEKTMTEVAREFYKAWKMIKEHQKEKDKAAAKAEVMKAEIESIMADDSFKAKMQSLPHPRGFKSFNTGEPLTAWDNVEWMFSNSGAAGRARLLKSLKAAM